MDIEFDPTKDAINRDKHGVSLAFGERIFTDASAVVLPSFREIDGEMRFKVSGLVDEKLWTAVFVRRGTVIRLISVRRSNDGEHRLYDRA